MIRILALETAVKLSLIRLCYSSAEGFEPPTGGFGDRCSTGLSYTPIGLSAHKHARGVTLPRELHYSMIFEIVPAPIVRPPSRIAKRIPSSIATGVMSSAVISMLSPGITISVPAGSSTVPVTSVVRK
jgi:hypothetical protein